MEGATKVHHMRLCSHNLYSEVQSAKPGAKPGGLNIGVQVGLTQTSISNNALLLAMNIHHHLVQSRILLTVLETGYRQRTGRI